MSEPTPSERGPDGRSLAERALDLLVYLPAGLAVTAAEDLPELTAKGRRRVETQVRNARFLGEMAVRVGGRSLQSRVEQLVGRTRPHEGTPPPPGTGGGPAGGERPGPQPGRPERPEWATEWPGRATGVTGAAPGTPSGAGEEPGETVASGGPPGGNPPAGQTGPAAPDGSPRTAGPAASAAVDSVIADYDALSASQVVQRLEGLGPPELEAIYRYELGSRGRRTILHRAQQLLGVESPPGGPPSDQRPA